MRKIHTKNLLPAIFGGRINFSNFRHKANSSLYLFYRDSECKFSFETSLFYLVMYQIELRKSSRMLKTCEKKSSVKCTIEKNTNSLVKINWHVGSKCWQLAIDWMQKFLVHNVVDMGCHHSSVYNIGGQPLTKLVTLVLNARTKTKCCQYQKSDLSRICGNISAICKFSPQNKCYWHQKLNWIFSDMSGSYKCSCQNRCYQHKKLDFNWILVGGMSPICLQ